MCGTSIGITPMSPDWRILITRGVSINHVEYYLVGDLD